ncbi:MAG: M48 family metallopeptidase [Clostridiales bacterium]|nr:M48 family metallopeptidase [Clostridiales bacterium]
MQIDKLVRSNRKTISLQIDESAKLIVRAPYHISKNIINKFIDEKSAWIDKKQNLMKQHNEHNNIEYEDGKIFLFLGKKYQLRINDTIKSIMIYEDNIEFPFKYIENAKKQMVIWYKRKAKEIIIPRAEEHVKNLNLNHNKIGINSAQKRWGSCNANGNINFSYRLIMAPIDVIDYVIIHELMHLKELNHSSQFWKLVESILPDYKIRRKWLKNNDFKMKL